MAAGIVYLSEDRKGKGLLLQQNLRVNLTLAALDSSRAAPFIDGRAEEKALDRRHQAISTSAPGAATCWPASSPAATSRSCCSPR